MAIVAPNPVAPPPRHSSSLSSTSRREARFLNRLFRSKFFPLLFQLSNLAVLVLLIADGFAANTQDAAFATILRNTNLANLIVWCYWWPLIILASILVGRVWCMVCPMELLTSVAARFGLKRQPANWMKSGWVVTLFYVTILFAGIQTFAIHRVPFRMALYLLTLVLAAIAVGLVFWKNTFCASVCPVGHLLGLYSRVSPFTWGVRNKSICEQCTDRSCVSKLTRYEFQGRSCGVGLRPANMVGSSECLLCTQCLKACDRNNPGINARPNPGWFYRGWFKQLWNSAPITAAQAVFLFIVSGFVISEVLTEWDVTTKILLYVPEAVQRLLPGYWPAGLTEALLLFVGLPLLVWGLPYGALRIIGTNVKTLEFAQIAAIAFIPIMAAAHASKALLKTTSRLPYWNTALSDPAGLNTARLIQSEALQLGSTPAWLDPLVSALTISFLCAGVLLSIISVRKQIKQFQSLRRTWPFHIIPALYGGIFLTTLIAWRLF